MNIQEAVDAGRFHHQWLPDYISYEDNCFDDEVIHQLTDLGHELKHRPALGRVNAILVCSDGRKVGGADKRGNNSSSRY